jgi:diguanylate cyclase (GGDEF)-like protein
MSGIAATDRALRALDGFADRALVVVSTEMRVVYASQGLRFLGYGPSDFDGTSPISDFVHPDDAVRVIEELGRQQSPGMAGRMRQWTEQAGVVPVHVRLRRRDGGWEWCQIETVNCLDQPDVEAMGFLVGPSATRASLDAAIHLVGTGAELTDVLAELVSILERQLPGAPALISHVTERGVEDVDRTGMVVNHPWADVMRRTLGGSSPELILVGADEIADRDLRPDVRQVSVLPITAPGGVELIGAIAAGTGWNGEPLMGLTDIMRTIGNLAALAIELDRRNGELRRWADLDTLTGVANRGCFDRWLRELEPQPELGVIAVDLDRFKPVNDAHGHAVGDRVLAQVARRIATSVRATDLVARVGGDEFAVLCAGVDDELLAEIAERIERRVTEPITEGRITVSVGASTGVAMRGVDEPLRATVERADTACYAVKATRRGAGTPTR